MSKHLGAVGMGLLLAAGVGCTGNGGGESSSSSGGGVTSSSGGQVVTSTGGGTSNAGGSSNGGGTSNGAGTSGAGGSSGTQASSGQPPQCDAYNHRGQTYNCSALDRCTETDLNYRLACCSCDSLYCEPDPTCPNPSSSSSGGGTGSTGGPMVAETCMRCHNGSANDDYAGTGLENPHPWLNVKCTQCHGGNGAAPGKTEAHVPPPPAVGDKEYQRLNPHAYFNRLTLQGMDHFPDYTDTRQGAASGTMLSPLEYLQFVNPGDNRVVQLGRSCGLCHAGHAAWAKGSPIATEMGFFSTSTYYIGLENYFADRRSGANAPNTDYNTAADFAWREWIDNTYTAGTRTAGQIGRTVAVPETAQYNGTIRDNPDYTAAALADDQYDPALFPDRAGRVRGGTALANVVVEQVMITCGDCHAGAAGANNRYADFRSSGCTVCHMQYSMDGRSRSRDSNVNKQEPLNPDAINAALAERPHVETHQIRNVAKVLPNGAFIRGISDNACAGCHQGSNRTVLQYWGIRLDQNADVVNNFQYPANPVNFANTAQDERLYDASVNNQTFNGRNANQYILTEDYDGDNRDDTPADIHYERGLGCIDCHGSRDVHAGVEGDPQSGQIKSRMDQVVKIRCENCHGTIEAYAPTISCNTYQGSTADCTKDASNNPIRHVTKDVTNNYWLISRLNGERHYVPQTRDAVARNNRRHPITQQLLYNPKASYAMGRQDQDPSNGAGPIQANPALVANGFSHTDNMDCTSCHASWNNQCIGCHARTQYDANPANYFFSNATGERILLKQQNADFSYITPLPMYLGVNSKGKITQVMAGMKVFYAYTDLNGATSQVFSFSDRNGNGNNPNFQGRNAHPSLGFNQMAAHSIRGKVTATQEGSRYCVACHMTQDGLNNFGAAYAQFAVDYFDRNYAALNYPLLQQHIGQNTSNQLNSPFWVHMVAGLGTGLYLFDDTACPVNPLDNNTNRFFCNGQSPAQRFAANAFNNVRYDADRHVEWNPTTFLGGVSNGMGIHPMLNPAGSTLRAGSLNPNHTGPLGATMINKLANTNNAQGGRVLDSWMDANANAQGNLNLNALP